MSLDVKEAFGEVLIGFLRPSHSYPGRICLLGLFSCFAAFGYPSSCSIPIFPFPLSPPSSFLLLPSPLSPPHLLLFFLLLISFPPPSSPSPPPLPSCPFFSKVGGGVFSLYLSICFPKTSTFSFSSGCAPDGLHPWHVL